MITTNANPQGYLRRKEAAEFLGISERHLATLVRRRIVPCIRLGHRCVLFEPEKIRRALLKYEEVEIGR